MGMWQKDDYAYNSNIVMISKRGQGFSLASVLASCCEGDIYEGLNPSISTI